MIALFEKLAVTQHEDDVGILYRCQSVGHNHHGAPLSGALKGGLHELLAFRIKRAGGLVEKQDVRVSDQSAGDCYTLLLATG